MMADDAKASILIVDDLPEKILAYRSVLEELGQHLVTANSGAEALKQVLKNDFAVILLDVNMPDMDGFETARLIRQRRLSAHIPIIFLTAFADDVRTAEGYATGGVDYLPTPVVPEVLRAKVRVFVDLYEMRQQVAQRAEEHTLRAVAEEAARRSEFLSDASRAIASSLDVETTLRRVPRLVVPFLADLALVCLADNDRQAGPAEFAWIDGAVGDNAETGRQVASRASRPIDTLAAAIGRVLATGCPERLDEPIDHLLKPAGDGPDSSSPEIDSVPSPPGIDTAIVLPLIARGATFGTLVLALGPSGRRFSASDEALAEELAARVAIALDNALLVRDIQENDLRKDEFLAMLAHELRNPLAPIRSGLDLLVRTGGDTSIISPMQRQVKHLVRLVDDLLDVSRITRGTIELQQQQVDLRSVIASAVETTLAQVENDRHDLKVIVADEPLTVDGDPVRLVQVLTNLLNNAAKFTPESGQISLTAEREGDEVVIHVCDTGAGIPGDRLSQVFDLFVQVDETIDRAHGGLGIGLTLVRRIVEMHGGRTEVFSDGCDRGSEFVVRLPYVPPQADQPRDTPPKASTGEELAPSRILVVDDNVDAATTLGMLLRLGGHEVLLSHDGPAALEAARSFVPDVVLLDIGLPGLDGYGVARVLRQSPETESALLIAVSGYGQDEDRRRSREAGFDQHLTKPVDFDVLTALLARESSQVPTG